MEWRKAHRVGRSSTAVTLPFEWVVKNNISPGDDLQIHESDENTLLISTSMDTKDDSSSRNFEIRSNTPPEHLSRLLIGSYVVGVVDIEFTCTNSDFATEQLEVLNNCISRLTGFLVVEQTDRVFKVHNYLEPTATLFSEHLRQLVSTTTRIVRMIPGLLESPGDESLYRRVNTMGDQSDMLYYLIVRILLTSLSDRNLMVDLGFDSSQEAVGSRLIAKSLEEICDRVERIAELTHHCDKIWEISPKLIKTLNEKINHICNLIEVAVEGYFTGSVILPDSALQELYDLEQSKKGPIQSLISASTDVEVATTLAVARTLVTEIARLTRVIGEVAMNNSLRRM
jgi:phosphate uptake regulator